MRKLVGLGLPALIALVLASPASAATTHETFPFDDTITDCGNTIEVSGDVVATFQTTATPSGGFILSEHFVPRGVTGTDEFGRTYHANGLTRDITVFTPAGGETFTAINRFHIVGTRGAPTFYIKETTHITVTPSGDVVANFDRFSVQCV